MSTKQSTMLMSMQYSQTSIAVCNHAFHHNPDVWGDDHNIFNPFRWENPDIAAKARLLMHFGLGGRQCIGKTIAMTNIYKLMSTLLREFTFELADKQAQEKCLSSGNIPELISVGISDLKEPLMVRAHVRVHEKVKREHDCEIPGPIIPHNQ